MILLGSFGLESYRSRGQADIDVATQLLNERSFDLLETQATSIATDLASFLREQDSNLRSLSDISRAEEAYLEFMMVNRSDIWTVDTSGDEVNLAHPLYREVAFVDLDGQEVIKVENFCFVYPWDCEPETSSDLLDISDPTNTWFQSEDYFAQAQSLEDDEIYVARPTGWYVSPFESYKSAQSPLGKRFEGVIRFIMPVVEEGERIGYVTFALDHLHIMEFSAHTDPTSTRPLPVVDPQRDNIAYMVGSDGAAISHVLHHNIAGVDQNGEAVPFLSESGAGPGNFYSMGFLSPVFPQLMDRMQAQPVGIVEQYTVNDLRRSLGYSVVPYHTGLNYEDRRGFGVVIVSMNHDALLIGTDVLETQLSNSLTELTTQLASLIAVIGLLAVILTLVMARGVVRPIRNLIAHSSSMEQQNLTDVEIARLKSIKGSSEVAQLTRTFGTMAETVRNREGQIARLLEETDKSLNRRIQELSTLGRVGQTLTSTFKLDEILRFATDAMHDGTHANAVQLEIEANSIGLADDLSFSTSDEPKSTDVETSLAIILDGQRVGQFRVYTDDEQLDGIELVFAEQVADWVTTAVQNARQFAYIQAQQKGTPGGQPG